MWRVTFHYLCQTKRVWAVAAMIFDIPWFIGVPVIVAELFFLYGIGKWYERQLDEQEEQEQTKSKKLQDD